MENPILYLNIVKVDDRKHRTFQQCAPHGHGKNLPRAGTSFIIDQAGLLAARRLQIHDFGIARQSPALGDLSS
jgi:hypothetical protein